MAFSYHLLVEPKNQDQFTCIRDFVRAIVLSDAVHSIDTAWSPSYTDGIGSKDPACLFTNSKYHKPSCGASLPEKHATTRPFLSRKTPSASSKVPSGNEPSFPQRDMPAMVLKALSGTKRTLVSISSLVSPPCLRMSRQTVPTPWATVPDALIKGAMGRKEVNSGRRLHIEWELEKERDQALPLDWVGWVAGGCGAALSACSDVVEERELLDGVR